MDQLAALKSLFKDCLREIVREELSTGKDSPGVEDMNAPRDCMDIHQLADYLQCSEQSIRNWQSRTDNPLPHGYIGADPRYFLAEIREWSHENARRRRKNKSDQAEEKPNAQRKPARRMPPTLMAASPKKGGKNADIQTVSGQTH